MEDKLYIKKLQVTGEDKQYRQLSVGIPKEFAKRYSFKEGEYIIATLTREGILLKKIKQQEKVNLDMTPKNWPKNSGIEFTPVSLKEFDIPYDCDFLLPAYEKKDSVNLLIASHIVL
ncbi:MAG: hypothetical protein AYK22_04715 [Thermoplasmatales archaeon SG8-52-3]|nr:MAG: hypothetical protein AYK22_04715 [Thermoplasmatales archaeon SG8-52-3]